MNTDIQRFICEVYDAAHHDGGGQPITLARVREMILPSVEAHLEQADRDIETEAVLLVNAVLGKERDRRSNQLKRELEEILRYYDQPASREFILSPLLGRAYALGTPSGEDRLLEAWTREDLRRLGETRMRDAAGSISAAREFRAVADQLTEAMTTNGANTISDLVRVEELAA